MAKTSGRTSGETARAAHRRRDHADQRDAHPADGGCIPTRRMSGRKRPASPRRLVTTTGHALTHDDKRGPTMSLHGMLEPETDDIDAPPCADRDGDLVGALRRGEARAAELLVTRYSERAYCLASRITGNREDAEEVVQDAFWTVVRKIDSFRGEAAFGSWLHRIVANAAYEKLRRRQRRRQDLSLDEVLPRFDELGHRVAPVADWSANANNPALETELRTVLTVAIDELPAACRAALLLRVVEGRSSRDIAHALKLSVPVVKTRVHRARLFLRKRLGAYEVAHVVTRTC